MLTIPEITSLINALGTRQNAGKIAYLKRRESQYGHHSSPTAVRFLSDLEQVPTVQADTYSHPEAAAHTQTTRVGDTLTPADLIWLQRLPADPAKVTHDDAVTLAAMMHRLNAMTNASDSRLIKSIARPVMDYHDQKAAEVAAENVQKPLPTVPQSALAALCEAVRNSTTELTDDEVVSRASATLRDILAQREAAKSDARSAARMTPTVGRQ